MNNFWILVIKSTHILVRHHSLMRARTVMNTDTFHPFWFPIMLNTFCKTSQISEKILWKYSLNPHTHTSTILLMSGNIREQYQTCSTLLEVKVERKPWWQFTRANYKWIKNLRDNTEIIYHKRTTSPVIRPHERPSELIYWAETRLTTRCSPYMRMLF